VLNGLAEVDGSLVHETEKPAVSLGPISGSIAFAVAKFILTVMLSRYIK
jgi:hypothetical protein